MGVLIYDSLTITAQEVQPIRMFTIGNKKVFSNWGYVDVLLQIETPDKIQKIPVSHVWIKTQVYDTTDMFSLIVQFRDSLPDMIGFRDRNLFKFPEWTVQEKLSKVAALVNTFNEDRPEEKLDPVYLRNSVQIEYFELLSLWERVEHG